MGLRCERTREDAGVRRTAWAAAMAMGLALACTDAGPRIERDTIAGQPIEIWRVRNARSAVVLLHGYGGDERLLDGRHQALVERLHEQGWTVAASLAHGDAWGDDRSVADYEALIARLRQDGAQRIALVGVSMGGLPGLRLMERGKAEAFVGVNAVTDTRALTHPTLTASARGSTPHDWDEGALRAKAVTFVVEPDDDIVPAPRPLATDIGAEMEECSGGHTSTDCLLTAAEILGEAVTR